MLAEYSDYLIHRQWMSHALQLAQLAGDAGDVPVGAVIVDSRGNLLAEGENRKERDHDPTAHAEIIAIRQAAQKSQTWRLHGCTLYVTLEPCPMCAGAMIQARMAQLVYGLDDAKTGAVRTVANIPDSAVSNHRLHVVGGILEHQCREQLQSWFSQRRQLSNSANKKDRGETVQ
jgi:tRNA(adenine34) deaminase